MPDTIFVGRQAELSRVHSFLEKATLGKPQVVFVTGEAGSGKSTLVEEFIHQSEEENPKLIAAIGECNAQTGISDPYLPFREILTSLTAVKGPEGSPREAEKKKKLNRWRDFAEIATKTLLMLGPDLVGIFIPGGSIIGRLGMAVGLNTNLAAKLSKQIGKKQDKANPQVDASLDQEKIFEQYTAVLKTLSKDHTLILVLDDLQWADSGSIALLFHLARELKESRILLVGTFRPDDIALGRAGERHPLEPVLNELKRYYGEIVIDLSKASQEEARTFVDELVDTEPNSLDRSFRDELLAHTGGQPLFTVELLRNMQELGILVRDDKGVWIKARQVDWETLPARIDGVISERVARLPAELHQILTVASVMGAAFIAQVIAGVASLDEHELLKSLSRELEKRYFLVEEQGEVRVGMQYLSQYRFSHMLIQQYLYNDISAAEKRIFHGEIAKSLEGFYADHAPEISLQLARHYEAAGNNEKAVDYLVMSGDRAYAAYAFTEAISAFERVLSLGGKDFLNTERLTHVYLQLGRALELNKQFDQALQTYTEMLTAAQGCQDRSMELASRVAASTLYSTPTPVADAAKGQALSQESLELARALGDRAAEAKVLWNLQLVNLLQNKAAEAIDYGEKSLAIARELNLTDQVAYVLSDLGWAYGIGCQFEKAFERLDEGARLWRQLGNKTMLSNHLNTTLFSSFWMGKNEAVLSIAEESYQLSASIREVWTQASARSFQGQVWFEQGEIDKALSALEESIDLAEQGNLIYAGWYRAMLCQAFGELGAISQGMEQYRSHRIADDDIPQVSLRTAMLVAYATFEIASRQFETAAATLAHCIPDASPWEAIIILARCKLALACSDSAAARSLADSVVELTRREGLGQFLPEALFLQAKSLLLQEDRAKAKAVLEQACIEAEKLGSRQLLWQIIAVQADLESEQRASQAKKAEAGAIVNAIASTITPTDVREAFLQSTSVQLS